MINNRRETDSTHIFEFRGTVFLWGVVDPSENELQYDEQEIAEGNGIIVWVNTLAKPKGSVLLVQYGFPSTKGSQPTHGTSKSRTRPQIAHWDDCNLAR
jgi:hypothetical protein